MHDGRLAQKVDPNSRKGVFLALHGSDFPGTISVEER